MKITKVLLTKEDKLLIENKLIEKDIRKQQLANFLFITPNTLSKIINGKQAVSIELIKKIFIVLEIKLGAYYE